MKLIPRGVDPNLFRAQLAASQNDPQSLRTMAHISESLRQQINPGSLSGS